jgi:2-polyprenyl-3-methyl-5-hydroxy-6-metoxy-1,4-benzoquinol methylase
VNERASAILKWTNGPAVLDLGCAAVSYSQSVPDASDESWLHVQLRRHFDDVWGLDFAEHAVSRMHNLGFTNVFHGDAQAFSLGRSFDTIVIGELIEHVQNPEGVLQSARDHLNPGGRVVITTPYPFSALYFLYSLRNYPKTCVNPEHVAWYCPTTLRELVTRCGFSVLHADLVRDYAPGQGSRPYRAFTAFVLAMGRVLPKRLSHNAMLFVLTTEDLQA